MLLQAISVVGVCFGRMKGKYLGRTDVRKGGDRMDRCVLMGQVFIDR